MFRTSGKPNLDRLFLLSIAVCTFAVIGQLSGCANRTGSAAAENSRSNSEPVARQPPADAVGDDEPDTVVTDIDDDVTSLTEQQITALQSADWIADFDKTMSFRKNRQREKEEREKLARSLCLDQQVQIQFLDNGLRLRDSGSIMHTITVDLESITAGEIIHYIDKDKFAFRYGDRADPFWIVLVRR